MHPATPSSWLFAGKPRPGAPKLYCFAHAGGSATEYLRWGRDLPDAEFHAVQLPGRGSRYGQPMFRSMEELVTAFVDEVPLGPEPYAFFGHSLGSLVAYEVTRALRDAGRPLPARLVLSAFPAPHHRHARALDPLHRLSDDDLIRRVAEIHGGIPQEVLDSAELRELVVGALRADYRVLETYTWREAAPLPVPMTVLGGRDDYRIDLLDDWRSHTTRDLTVRHFPGGHFYLRDEPGPVLQALAQALSDVNTPAGGPAF
ncbi:thioesterase II family protein [Streptomyces sp. NBC_00083]|uniref:thioesterase II family protein n=1 Tax=Streptomyces sp. NBC_00083 TaxID=2975647 RepID=UPI0022511DFE|nr:alpha/beta fold hydrolase [Streptomyces sp. NBC_00083]MCX5386742.1 alpha/beta fold hydrolase [Streptomyces sp. NBC_00083]